MAGRNSASIPGVRSLEYFGPLFRNVLFEETISNKIYPPYLFSAIGGLWAGRILESGQNGAQLQLCESISLLVTLTKLLFENGLSSRFLFRLRVEIASKIQRFRAPARPIWNG